MDLMVKNFPYFVEVYFNFTLADFLIVFFITMSILVAVQGFHGNEKRDSKILLWTTVFSFYVSTVVCITLLNHNRMQCRQLILNPMYEIIGLRGELGIHYLRGMGSNVLMFIPFGILIPMHFRESDVIHCIVRGLIFSVTIEVAQYIFQKGVTESMDVVCNVVGTLFGSVFFCAIEKLRERIVL